MDEQTARKLAAAKEAADLITSGMVVGLGTGSTATLFIAELCERAKAGLNIRCIPTSERSAVQASAGGLEVIGFAEASEIDVAVDGADEIATGSLDLIKGLGGALLREKIVASAAKCFVVIADDSKLVEQLGTRAPVPVEVTGFGHERVSFLLGKLGARVVLRELDGKPYRTDGGNLILDSFFGKIAAPATLDREIRSISGVIDTGIFAGLTDLVLLAGASGVRRIKRA